MLMLFAETDSFNGLIIAVVNIIVGAILAGFLAWIKRGQTEATKKSDEAAAAADTASKQAINAATAAKQARSVAEMHADNASRQLNDIRGIVVSHGEALVEQDRKLDTITEHTNGLLAAAHTQGMKDQKEDDAKGKTS